MSDGTLPFNAAQLRFRVGHHGDNIFLLPKIRCGQIRSQCRLSLEGYKDRERFPLSRVFSNLQCTTGTTHHYGTVLEPTKVNMVS